ncbi:MAG: hypothetical protein AAGF02_10220 [Actinomycetota bacterium]
MSALGALVALAPFELAPIGGESYFAVAIRPVLLLQLAVGVVVVALSVGGAFGPGAGRPPIWLGRAAAVLVVAVWISAAAGRHLPIGAAGATVVTAFVATVVATAAVVSADDEVARILRWMVGGAVVGAAIGLVVHAVGAEVGPTAWLHGEVTRIGLQHRLTRPWPHANVAAMALVVALVVQLGLDRGVREIRTVVGLALTSVALVLTYSRGGVVAALVGLVVVAALVRGRRLAVTAVVVVGVMGATALVSDGWVDRSSDDASIVDFRADVAVAAALDVDAVDPPVVPVTLTNRSGRSWSASGAEAVEISARWMDGDGFVVDEQRWPLDTDLGPGSSRTVELPLGVAVPDGDYVILWDVVIDGEAYFLQFSGGRSAMDVVVRGSDVGPVSGPPVVPARTDLNRDEIWTLAEEAFRDRPVIGVGPMQLVLQAREEIPNNRRFPGSHAHSLIWEPLSAWGLLGTIPFMVLLVGGAWAAWRRRAAPTGPAVLGGLAVVYVHGLVEWPLGHVGMSIPMAALLGLAWSSVGAEPRAVAEVPGRA